MNELPKIQLEITANNWFRVRKCRLTAESAVALFGKVHPHHDCGMPPFNPQYRQTVAYLDDANAAIYNERNAKKYEHLERQCASVPKPIVAGTVMVTEGDWDIRLTNIMDEK
jgi:hypothetical protein